MLLLFVHPFTHLLISTSVRLSYFHRHSARFHFKRVLCPSHYHIRRGRNFFLHGNFFISPLSLDLPHAYVCRYVDMGVNDWLRSFVRPIHTYCTYWEDKTKEERGKSFSSGWDHCGSSSTKPIFLPSSEKMDLPR